MNDDMNDGTANETLTVAEIFHSIQGESSRAGMPCVFVRLTGCNLRCRWCDTTYAYSGGVTMSVENVIETMSAFPCRLAEITGGEPLLQPASTILATRLLENNWTVLCETSGSLPIDRLPDGVIRIMDIKCPGSMMSDRNRWKNIPLLTTRDEVKFVLADHSDYEWAKDIINGHRLLERVHTVLMAPVPGELEPQRLSEWILTDGLPVRLQLQLHKYIWPPDQRGV